MGNGRSNKMSKFNKKGESKKGGKKKGEKILIIDDELDFLEAFRRTLEAKSYQVITTSGKERAQEIMGAEEPSLIVLGTLAPAGQAFSMYQ